MAGFPALAYEEPEYPESDGQPVAETQFHYDELTDLVKPLEGHFEADPDVWVAGNLFVYYVKGEPKAVVAPDVLVVRGVEKKKRRKYLLWEEKVPPCFVVELTSKSTRHEDTGRKKQKYAQLGVEELFLFDVLGEYLYPRFQGFRLMGGRYHEMRPLPDGSLHSRTLGLKLQPEGQALRLIDVATGEALLRIDKERKARKEAQSRVLTAETLGIAKAVLGLLANRGIEVDDDARAHVLACTDPDQLQDWLLRAATATKAEQVVQG